MTRSVHLAVYGALLALATVSVPVLSVVGMRALLDSRDGEIIDPVLDPTAPGYQALVSPSPTMVAIHTDPEGVLVGVVVLALAGDDVPGGSTLLIPPATLASVPTFGDLTLEYVQTVNGTDTTVSLTEWILSMAIDEVVEMDHQTWTDLIEPLGGLTITNPDTLTDHEGIVRFPAGEITLEPADVGPYLAMLGAGENPLNRVFRQELVWTEWYSALRADPDSTRFGGELDRGLARFVPTIATGPGRLVTLPLVPASTPPAPGEATVFIPDDEAITTLIPVIVPFPAGARPGDRPLVRVLDGSGRIEIITPAVRRVAIGGGQVVMVGNADAFDVAQTQLLYADPALGDFARSVAEALGVGSVQVVDYIDENAELIVVLGTDFEP